MNRLTIPMLRPGAEPVLAGRLAGKRAFLSALEQLPEMAEPTLVLLDFRDVALATSSYLSEAVLTLRDHLQLRRHPGYVVSVNLSDNVREEIEEMLRRSGDALITCATETNGLIRDVQLCGKLDIKLQETLALVSRKGETTAVELHAKSRHVDSSWSDSLEQPSDRLGGEKLDRGNLARPYKEIPAGTGDGLMGLDLVRKAAPGFIRVLDRRAVELRMPNLFSRDLPVDCPHRVCRNLRGREGHSRRKGSSPYHEGQGDRTARQPRDRGMP